MWSQATLRNMQYLCCRDIETILSIYRALDCEAEDLSSKPGSDLMQHISSQLYGQMGYRFEYCTVAHIVMLQKDVFHSLLL